ncbi:MAG: glycosyltransferase [Caldisericum sp.]|uniref:glycosyltransferase n=1 Tax=Caldisericum sp. TaxID=2499687 RepID=UPI003D0C76C8
MVYNIILYLTGFLGSLLSFFPFGVLKKGAVKLNKKVSVIIPARNEESNLINILEDLKNQTYKPYEIIVVNDESEDKTESIAKQNGAKVVSIKEKPKEVLGKPYACLKGFEESTQDLLLFLDADLRLGNDAIEKLLYTYELENAVISVWPYHEIKTLEENFSFFFNFIGAISLNNFSLINRFLPIQGLFGTCILIDRDTYEKTQGHKNVLKEVVEDLALGKVIAKKGIKIKNFLGRKDIKFRMYKGGFKELLSGWSKNFSKGAVSTHPLNFIIVFIFITATFSVLFHLKEYFIFAIFFSVEFLLVGRIIGNFNPVLLMLYPIHLFIFFIIFANSILQTFIKREVEWKGRKIKIR